MILALILFFRFSEIKYAYIPKEKIYFAKFGFALFILFTIDSCLSSFFCKAFTCLLVASIKSFLSAILRLHLLIKELVFKINWFNSSSYCLSISFSSNLKYLIINQAGKSSSHFSDRIILSANLLISGSLLVFNDSNSPFVNLIVFFYRF